MDTVEFSPSSQARPPQPPQAALHQWQPPPLANPAPPSRGPVLILIIVLALAIASAAGWWFWTHRQPSSRLGLPSDPGLPVKAPNRDPNQPIPLPKPTEVQPVAPAPNKEIK
jgi:hypothetical protein